MTMTESNAVASSAHYQVGSVLQIGLNCPSTALVKDFHDLKKVAKLFLSYNFDFRYGNLLVVHGRLDPLVNIDLSPEKRVKVKIVWGDKSEVKSINVYQTVSGDCLILFLTNFFSWILPTNLTDLFNSF